MCRVYSMRILVADSTMLCSRSASEQPKEFYDIDTIIHSSSLKTGLLSGDQHPQQEENHQHPKHLGHQPPVAAHAVPVLGQLALCPFDILQRVLGVGVYPLDLLAPHATHLGQLREQPAELRHRALDHVDL